MTADNAWWRGAVTYQIYPRSFQESDGDGVGDISGITRRLDHVASLGVDAIWLSPVFTSPMRDMGYDVSDDRGIDPLFGSIADFDTIPYFFQDHIHQKTQPENLPFIERLRAPTDSYNNRARVGEISAEYRARQVMGDYTRRSNRLPHADGLGWVRAGRFHLWHPVAAGQTPRNLPAIWPGRAMARS